MTAQRYRLMRRQGHDSHVVDTHYDRSLAVRRAQAMQARRDQRRAQDPSLPPCRYYVVDDAGRQQ